MSSTERQRIGCVAVVLISLLWIGSPQAADAPPRSETVSPVILDLTGPLTDPRAEVSGMAWHGDTLVVMPENPTLFAETDQLGFFVITRAQILAAIEGHAEGPIKPRPVMCVAPSMSRVVKGFDGLEAIGLLKKRCFMTLEAKDDTAMAGYLVRGDYDLVNEMVVMDLTRMAAIPLDCDIFNLTAETLVVDGDRIITISEANGRNVNPAPVGRVYGADLEYLGALPMPNIEYRVTDATSIDDQRRFWVINYFYPPDAAKLRPPVVPDGCVECLLELQIVRDADGNERIVRTDKPPLSLTLLPDSECRNWEAVARLDGRGFLLMTDKYPGTLLAFVPFTNQ